MAYDVIIVGNGPAGLSAALYTSRANLKTLVIGKDDGALTKADKIENYFGMAEPYPLRAGGEYQETGENVGSRAYRGRDFPYQLEWKLSAGRPEGNL